jgi:hypothetical protein
MLYGGGGGDGTGGGGDGTSGGGGDTAGGAGRRSGMITVGDDTAREAVVMRHVTCSPGAASASPASTGAGTSPAGSGGVFGSPPDGDGTRVRGGRLSGALEGVTLATGSGGGGSGGVESLFVVNPCFVEGGGGAHDGDGLPRRLPLLLSSYEVGAAANANAAARADTGGFGDSSAAGVAEDSGDDAEAAAGTVGGDGGAGDGFDGENDFGWSNGNGGGGKDGSNGGGGGGGGNGGGGSVGQSMMVDVSLDLAGIRVGGGPSAYGQTVSSGSGVGGGASVARDDATGTDHNTRSTSDITVNAARSGAAAGGLNMSYSSMRGALGAAAEAAAAVPAMLSELRVGPDENRSKRPSTCHSTHRRVLIRMPSCDNLRIFWPALMTGPEADVRDVHQRAGQSAAVRAAAAAAGAFRRAVLRHLAVAAAPG